jgi:lipopolysaccharide export LptBFGC system permease protein LptF
MAFNPRYTITEKILNNLTLIASAREVIEQAHLVPKWEASLRRQAKLRNTHSSTAIEGNKLTNIRIYEPQGPGKPARTIIAKKGEFISLPDKGIIKLKLMDGSSDEPNPNNPETFYKLNFKTNFINLNIAKAQQSQVNKKPKDMTLDELKNEIKRVNHTGIDPTPLITEIHKKVSLAFACLILVLIGCPLSIITKQRLKSVNFGLALVIFGIYYLLMLGANALSLEGLIPAHLAMWLPNIVFGMLGLIFTLSICVF